MLVAECVSISSTTELLFSRPIEGVFLFFCEPVFQGLKRLVDLAHVTGADQNCGDIALGESPGERQIDHGAPARIRKAAQIIEHGKTVVMEIGLVVAGNNLEPSPRRDYSVAAVFGGEKSCADGTVAEHAQGFPPTDGEDIAFDFPVIDEVELRLNGDKPGPVALLLNAK